MKELKEARASHAAHHAKMSKLAHPDEKQDRALVDKMVKPNALTGRSCGGSATTKRAHGGSVKGKSGKKPGTQVNIVVAPKRDGAAALPNGAPMPGPGAGMPSPAQVPAAPPRPAPPPQGGGIAALGAPRKHGGQVKRATGGSIKWLKAGSGSGEGRLEKTRHPVRRGK